MRLFVPLKTKQNQQTIKNPQLEKRPTPLDNTENSAGSGFPYHESFCSPKSLLFFFRLKKRRDVSTSLAPQSYSLPPETFPHRGRLLVSQDPVSQQNDAASRRCCTHPLHRSTARTTISPGVHESDRNDR